jgi:DNA-binding NtrC family response regulator
VSVPQSGINVLVIDDSNTIRRSAEIFLKQAGHAVQLAEDGFDALSKVSDNMPDVIDAASRRVPDLRHHQAQPQVRVGADCDVVVQRRRVRQSARSHGRVTRLFNEAL